MVLARIVLIELWIGVTAYALFAGADFGGGIWDLLAGGPGRGAPVRERIEHSIGPVWEANHVWLIFVLVTLWTAFPVVFSSLLSTLYIPFSVAGLGIILRGSSFALRKEAQPLRLRRLFGVLFATSSLLTPFAFGTVAGAVASGRVPSGIAVGDVIGAWLNPTALFGGFMAVATCAYLAAVYLTADARRAGEVSLVPYFRSRAMITGAALGVVGLAGGLLVIHGDAPALFTGLTGRALPLLGASAAFGLASLLLLRLQRYVLVRGTAGLATVAAIWSWGVAQYPALLPPALTLDNSAAPDPVLWALAIGLGVGAVLFVPALILLYGLAQGVVAPESAGAPARSRWT
jgi:cytochrome d ubiquinol oxidase subunit II